MKKQFNIKKTPTSCLLVGSPGSGKTSCALQIFPSPYVLDCDDNLLAAVEFTNFCDFSYDVANKSDMDVMIDDSDRGTISRYDLMIRRINEAARDPEIKTIIIDSLGTFSDILISEVKKRQSRKDNDTMRIQDWGDFSYLLKHIVITCKSSNKHFVATAHVSMEKDEADGRYKNFIFVPGGSKVHIPGLFAHCVLLYSQIKGVPPNTKTVRMVRTAAENALDFRGLKSSYFESDCVELETFKKTFKSRLTV